MSLSALIRFHPWLSVLVFCSLAAAAPTDDWTHDLSGVWQGPYTPDLTRGTDAELTPWGKEKFAHFDGKMDPCLPVGVTRPSGAAGRRWA